MNYNQRGRVRKQKGSVLRTEKSASGSTITTEKMVVIPKETFLEMEEKWKILAEFHSAFQWKNKLFKMKSQYQVQT